MKPEDFGRKLKAAIERVTTRDNLKTIGDEMSDRIRKRTRLGYGVRDKGGEREKLDDLSDSYISLRRRLSLSKATTPAKSNLTLTGQMLDSIKVKKIDKNSVRVGPEGGRDDGELTNEELAQHVADQGRPFNTLSKPEIKGLIRFINEMLSRILKL